MAELATVGPPAERLLNAAVATDVVARGRENEALPHPPLSSNRPGGTIGRADLLETSDLTINNYLPRPRHGIGIGHQPIPRTGLQAG